MKYPIIRIEKQNHPFWEITSPPEAIFVQGSKTALKWIEHLPERGLAVVGTRDPQARSLALIDQILSRLSGSGLVILSGLARGIDAQAHLCALRYGLPTIAVLGAGLDIPYPTATLDLRNDILNRDGLLISEFPPGTPARSFQFLRRNRLIAGWSKATWVVEASFRSGALNTARWAREQNRVCLSVPSYPGDPALSGNQTLLDRDHAYAFWGTHSLGTAWIELAAQKAARISDPGSDIFIREICQEVRIQTYKNGGTSTHDLLSWALLKNWDATTFFRSLHACITHGFVKAQQGMLIRLG